MTLETLFQWATFGILPFWALLALAPAWSWTQRLVHGPLVLLVLTPLYGYLLFGHGASSEEANMMSLYGVMTAFTAPHIALAGWIHYLIFDLFIGAWEAREAQRRGVPHLALIPCLAATLMVGPIGLALFIVVRFVSSRRIEYPETESA